MKQIFTCPKSTIETLEKVLWCFPRIQWHCSWVFIVNFEHISCLFLVPVSLTLNKWEFAGILYSYGKAKAHGIRYFKMLLENMYGVFSLIFVKASWRKCVQHAVSYLTFVKASCIVWKVSKYGPEKLHLDTLSCCGGWWTFGNNSFEAIIHSNVFVWDSWDESILWYGWNTFVIQK